jgi:hypothetical protein
VKKFLRTLVICLAFTAESMAQGTQPAPSTSTNPSEPSAPSLQQDSQASSRASSANQGDKTIKGCIRFNNGKYTLESKHRKTIWLTGSEDFAPHLGHAVTVHGSFLPSTETSSAGQSSDFLVKQIDMVADRCTSETRKATKVERGPAPDQK